MSKKLGFKTIWRSAGLPGIVLAAVSISYLLINQWLGQSGFSWALVAVFLLDLAKIVFCIWLMHFFMKRFFEDNDAGKADVKAMGTVTAFLSALVFAAASMIFYMYHPELGDQILDSVAKYAGKGLDKNGMDALEKIMDDLPQIVFWSQLIYCFLFGWILSTILASRIVSNNPFANNSEE